MRRRDVLRLAGAGIAGLGAAGTAASAAPYEPLGRVAVEGAKEAVVGDDGTVAYVAATDGFAAVDVSDPASPAILAERRDLLADREDGPLGDIWDVAVDGDRLLVVGPAHHGPLAAALRYDVSDPGSPERVAVHETDYPIHNAFLDGERAYLTGNDGIRNPLVIVDMADPGEVGRWSPVDRDDGWLAVDPRLRTIHDVWVHDGIAYCCYWDAGTWIVDVSDPTSPAYRGRVGGRPRDELVGIDDPGRAATELPGNHHYAATDDAGSLLAVGKEAWRAGSDGPGPGGIDLWDVSDPAAPTRLSTIDPPPTPDPTYGGVWTTAHNFDLHGGRLYSAWYRGGVKIHDVRDPAAPERLAWWRRPDAASFWTAQHAAGGIVASDMGVGGEASIYTFPDRPGEQPDPPSLTPSPTPTPTETPSPTASRSPATARDGTTSRSDAAGTTATTPSRATTPTPTGSPTATPGHGPPGHSHSHTHTPAETPASAPGVGPLAALAAFLGGALAAARRRHDDG